MDQYEQNLLTIKQSEVEDLHYQLEQEKLAYKAWYGKVGEDGAPATWDNLEAKCKSYETALLFCLHAMEGSNGLVQMSEIQDAARYIHHVLGK